MRERIDKCPHCGSDRGVFTKMTLINVPKNYNFDGASGYFPKEFIIEAIKTHMSQSKGEWKWISDDDVICSACGSVFYTDDNADAGTSLWHFCPKCGAKIKGGERDDQ